VGVLDGNRNSSIIIRQWGYGERQPNFFDHHLIHCHCSMVTKFFQLPKKAWGEGHEMTTITKGG
jgi:hypothetical protein